MSGGFCKNRQPVREDVVVDAAISELKRVLLATDLYDQLTTKLYMQPLERGRYRALSTIFPLDLEGGSRKSWAISEASDVVGNDGCAGSAIRLSGPTNSWGCRGLGPVRGVDSHRLVSVKPRP